VNPSVLLTVEAGVARVTLNRPEKRNALDRGTIAALTSELQRCAGDPAVRLVQITGAGKAFCAGADLNEMQAQAGASEAANLADAEQLALCWRSWIRCRNRPWHASTATAMAEHWD
jgi:enoyl-CoA hydratase/carnithine racemase